MEDVPTAGAGGLLGEVLEVGVEVLEGLEVVFQVLGLVFQWRSTEVVLFLKMPTMMLVVEEGEGGAAILLVRLWR